MSEEMIEVVIDDLPVPVSKADWEADHDAVEDAVRAARRGLTDLSSLPYSADDFEDFDEVGDCQDEGVSE